MNLHQTALAVETLRPGDEGYDASARGFFSTARPALVMRPRQVDEVVTALAHAARHGLTVAVRSGGHGPLDHQANDGSIMIDLIHLDDVEILDTERRLVRIGAGANWGQVAAALDQHGWILSAGDTNDVGVGGLTLGGGFGWLVRRCGLAIDSLVAARVVTADGRLVRTSEDEHPDLFWALRGGGGNFGVVIDFDFVAQPISAVHFGSATYQVGDTADLLAKWRDAMRSAPDELSSSLALTPSIPGADPSAVVQFCYADESGCAQYEADEAIEPLLKLGTVVHATIAERRYADILENAKAPTGLRVVTRNTLVATLDDDAIGAIVRFRAVAGSTPVVLRSLGGAFGRVPQDATAFAHRDAEAMIIAVFLLPEAAAHTEIEQALLPWRVISDQGTGVYINFQGASTEADLAAAYPATTHARLAEVKRAWDPDNRFALNHNIAPAKSDGLAFGAECRR